MPVTTLTREVTASSETGPDDAVRQAIAGVTAEINEVEHVEVKRVEVLLQDTNVSGYRLTLEVTHGNDAEPTTGRETGSRPVWSRHHKSDPERSLTGPLPLGPEPVPLRIDEDGVARIGQTRVTLDTVVAAFRLGETAEGIAESYPALRLADVYRIVGYYLRHRDAVDAYVAGREREAGRLREEIEADLDPTGLRTRLLARRADEQQRHVLRLAADEDFNNVVLHGAQRRNADLDIVRVQDVVGLSGTDDATLLQWTDREDRVLFTHDVNTMTAQAYQRIKSGEPMPGLFAVPRDVPVGDVIEDLLLIAEYSTKEDWQGQVSYLPL